MKKYKFSEEFRKISSSLAIFVVTRSIKDFFIKKTLLTINWSGFFDIYLYGKSIPFTLKHDTVRCISACNKIGICKNVE